MDAQTLFREGVLALQAKNDPVEARRLLLESLKVNPNNEMAWLWLSRTTDDPKKKLQCVERALRLNPQNEQALTLRAKLIAAVPKTSPFALNPTFADDSPAPAQPSDTRPASRQFSPPSDDDFDDLLAAADEALKEGEAEEAIGFWVRVLDIQPDHPVAIQNAVRQLYKLGYKEDASELIDQAIQSGTTSIPIFLTGIDLARLQNEAGKADRLREQVAVLPDADDALILKQVEYFVESGQLVRGVDLLKQVLALHPDRKALRERMGDLQANVRDDRFGALSHYDRATKVTGSSKAVKAGKADAAKQRENFTPTITDRERGSIGLALREAVGFGVVFLLLGWQDAGLDLLRMGSARWIGVGLSIFGGYLLVTALSAPQQKPLGSWFGGKVPEPPPPDPDPKPAYEEPKHEAGPIQEPTSLPIIPTSLRALFAIAGLVILGLAFMLVFSASIALLSQPVRPNDIPSIYDLIAE
jgi:tetratricopeptide (TPR) repeat protein